MECPKCFKDTFVILAIETEGHLMGCKYTIWCKTCGTTAKVFNIEAGKLHDVRTPETMEAVG